MPFYLKESDYLPQVAELESILIVPCRFCPAASLAVRENKPYIEPFRRLLRTESYETFIETLRRRLEDGGIRTAVFDSKLLHQFVACMWTANRRSELANRAAEFDGVLVLGCEAMVQAVGESIAATDCQVIRGMEIEGLMNVLPRVSLPLTLSLELQGIAPVTAAKKPPA